VAPVRLGNDSPTDPDVRASPTGDDRMAEPAEDPALAYFRRVRRAFAGAARRGGGYAEHRLQIGGVEVRLRLVGVGLGPVVLPALAPVMGRGGGRPDIEVELWDRATTGVGVPPPPWKLRDVITRGDVRGVSGSRIRAQVDTGSESLTMWDSSDRVGIMWAADARRLPYWVRAAPLRSILHWGLASAERHLVHAAAVGDEHSGALLAGPSGSGKSTTALACLQAGLGYVADDYVLAEIAPALRAVGLYGTAKTTIGSLSLLPGLADAVALTPETPKGVVDIAPTPVPPKTVVDIARSRPDLVRRSAAISAILLPRITPGRLALRPVAAADALRALAPSTILQHAHESAGGMAVMSALVRRVPAYALDLGSDIAAVAPAIRTLLEAQQ
jgi:hypothetical protein